MISDRASELMHVTALRLRAAEKGTQAFCREISFGKLRMRNMVLAKVVGTVVSTRKEEKIEGIKFLLLEKVNPETMKGKKDYVVAMDSVGAGLGEIVFYVSGSSSRMTETTQGRPSDATITAIVDSIDMNGEFVYQKDASL